MSNCWYYAGYTDGNNYAELFREGVRYKVHRLMYEAVKGVIPSTYVIDHLCRTHNCINPDHLEAVTNRENVLRGVGITAKSALKTHCINGHEFTEANTRKNGNKRYCRACARETYHKRKRLGLDT